MWEREPPTGGCLFDNRANKSSQLTVFVESGLSIVVLLPSGTEPAECSPVGLPGSWLIFSGLLLYFLEQNLLETSMPVI